MTAQIMFPSKLNQITKHLKWNCASHQNFIRCGNDPKISEMTGDDADILCGEWDTNGSNGASTSGEKYNIALTIKEIVRHPDYVVNPGTEQSYLQNDIAVFKVDEGPLSQVHLIVMRKMLLCGKKFLFAGCN